MTATATGAVDWSMVLVVVVGSEPGLVASGAVARQAAPSSRSELYACLHGRKHCLIKLGDALLKL